MNNGASAMIITESSLSEADLVNLPRSGVPVKVRPDLAAF
jgi:hypothetical protein